MAGNLADVITCAKFQNDIFRGYNFTGGCRISQFRIDFCMGLTTVQTEYPTEVSVIYGVPVIRESPPPAPRPVQDGEQSTGRTLQLTALLTVQ